MPYFNKHDVANYMITKYRKEKGYSISPLKLQKTLYLLYGMWGGNIRLLNIKESIHESEYDSPMDEEVFDARFQAWKYGPTDPDVYRNFKEELYTEDYDISTGSMRNPDSVIMDFMNDIFRQAFEVSDFSLVETVHEDQCWRRAYDKDETGMEYIPSNEIIEEYAERLKEKTDGL